MRLKEILNEAPFSDKQEERFLKALRADIKSNEFPPEKRVAKLVKDVSPPAKKLGSGAYSTAYGRDRSDKVIKITRDGDGTQTLRFLKWAKRRKHPNLPKIYSVEKIKDQHGDVHVYARMERLIPLNVRKYKWSPEHLQFLNWMSSTHNSEHPEDILGRARWRKFNRKHPKTNISARLIELVQDIERFDDNTDFHIPDHGTAHNIMVRPSTGELVFHDPIA